MLIEQNNLRLHRKQSQLIQSDLGHIMGLADYSNISHWELGHKKPSPEVLIIYHLLFNISIESLYGRLKKELKQTIAERINQLIGQLKSVPSDAKIASRISFLESALNRLTS